MERIHWEHGEDNTAQSTQISHGPPDGSLVSADHTREQHIALTNGDADGPQG